MEQYVTVWYQVRNWELQYTTLQNTGRTPSGI